MLLSFVFRDFQQQHCLLLNMTIECHVRSDLSRQAQEPIKLLLQVFARYFNKNSKATNQSDFNNNYMLSIVSQM